jgi:hypothetical protein
LAAHLPGIAFLAAISATAIVMMAKSNPISRSGGQIQLTTRPRRTTPIRFIAIKSP